jgi:hypothetical protein
LQDLGFQKLARIDLERLGELAKHRNGRAIDAGLKLTDVATIHFRPERKLLLTPPLLGSEPPQIPSVFRKSFIKNECGLLSIPDNILNKGRLSDKPADRPVSGPVQEPSKQGIEMESNQSFSGPRSPVNLQCSDNASASATRDDDADLLVLKMRFDELIRELPAAQPRDIELASTSEQQELGPDVELAGIAAVRRCTKRKQSWLVCTQLSRRLCRHRPARQAGLGVKASHAAYVMSEYWEAPIDQLDWDARTIRLLIEAICNFAGTPLPLLERTRVG